MEKITSPENSIYKYLKKLGTKKFRDKENCFIAEGPNIIRDVLEDGSAEVRYLFVREGSGADQGVTKNGRILSRKLFDDVADTETSQGILAVIGKPERRSVSQELGSCGPYSPVVILDRLQDPGNMGTIIRTAEAAGVSLIVTVKGTCDVFSPKVVRACAGSITRVKLIQGEDEDDVIAAMKSAGIKIAVSDMGGETGLFSKEFRDAAGGRLAIVIGNEGSGVSEKFKSEKDITVSIPMAGKIESLNAGVAAALMMYTATRPEN